MKIDLVKLGGSLITDKTRRETAREDVISRLAQEIASLPRSPDSALIVGHGSGSFGHPQALEHGVHEGVETGGGLAGVTSTQVAARRLHTIVVETLEEAGARPFSLPPAAFMLASGGRPTHLELGPLTAALELGLVPVVCGDVVLDREQGACICSTETVFLAIAELLQASDHDVRRVVWAGDTDGVYDARGDRIPEVSSATLSDVMSGVGVAAGADVTGGMRHRLETAALMAARGVTSWIVDGQEEGVLTAVLEGNGDVGTRFSG